MKDGIFTTEFWLTIIVLIGNILPTILGLLPVGKTSLICSAMIAIYTISRTIVKKTTSVNDDKIIEAIGQYIIPTIENNSKKNNLFYQNFKFLFQI